MQCSNCTSNTLCHEHQERSLNAASILPIDQDQRRDNATLTASSMSGDNEEGHQPRETESKSALRNDQNNDHSMVAQVNATDAQQRYQLEKEDNDALSPRKSPRILSFPHGDPENPYNWSTVCAPIMMGRSPRLTWYLGEEDLCSFCGHCVSHE